MRKNPERALLSMKVSRIRENIKYPTRQKDHMIKSKKKAVLRNIHFVDSYKLFWGCIDCGYRKDPRALVPDHVYGIKKYDVGFMVRAGHSLLPIVMELFKCLIRCANCHAIRHANEREGLP